MNHTSTFTNETFHFALLDRTTTSHCLWWSAGLWGELSRETILWGRYMGKFSGEYSHGKCPGRHWPGWVSVSPCRPRTHV